MLRNLSKLARIMDCTILNEVLSLNAQECVVFNYDVNMANLLNEVLSLNAQE